MTTNKTTDALLPDKHLWKGEPCHNPEKGWITDSRGNRITRLGNRNAYGKLIQQHNQEVELLYQSMTRAQPKPTHGVDYIRKDIVPQDRAKEALEAVEYCIKIISNHRIPKQENAIWSSGSSANPRITQETLETILALFVAHGGNK